MASAKKVIDLPFRGGQCIIVCINCACHISQKVSSSDVTSFHCPSCSFRWTEKFSDLKQRISKYNAGIAPERSYNYLANEWKRQETPEPTVEETPVEKPHGNKQKKF